MRNIGKIFRSDIRRIASSVVAVIVIMGLCLIPCLYAWFNILSNWDPYGPGSTSNIKVAVANEDSGGELLGLRFNIGELVMEGLEDNDHMGWVFLNSRQDALDGVYAGNYYAALIVPENFTGDFLSILDGELRHPQIEYYENEKKNAIAPKITGKAKTAVQEEINNTILEKAADAINAISSILRAMGLDAHAISQKLVSDLRSGSADLSHLSDLLHSVDQLLGDTGSVLNYSALVVDDTGKVMLSAGETVGSVGGVISTGSVAVGNISNTVASTLNDIDRHIASIIDTLTGSRDEQHTQSIKTLLDEIGSSLASLRSSAPALAQLDAAESALSTMKQLAADLDNLSNRETMLSHAEDIRVSLNAMSAQCSSMISESGKTSSIINELTPLLNGWASAAAPVDDSSDESAPKELPPEVDNTPLLNEKLEELQVALDGTYALAPLPPSLDAAYTELKFIKDSAPAVNDGYVRDEMLKSLERLDSVLVSSADSVNALVSQINDADNTVALLISEVKAMNGLGLDYLSEELTYIESRLEALKLSHPEIAEYIDAALERIADIRVLLGSIDLPDVREKIAAKANEIREIVRMAVLNFNNDVSTHIQNAADKAQAALQTVQDMLAGSASELGGISQTLGAYSSALGQAQLTVSSAIALSDLVGGYLSRLADDIERVTGSEAFKQLIDMIETNPDGLAEYLASPVDLRTVIIYEISDYGSAMSPYYIMLALFVGSLLTATMIKVQIKSGDLLGVRPIERYFGRFLLFFCIGMAQALVTSLGCLYYVGIQCLHPGLFILACCICSLNFAMMNYALVYSLDNIGMGLAVIIMVIQVAGSGGSYPIHVLPDIFQKLYPIMPFHYGMDMIRETIGGMYDGAYTSCALILLSMCLLFIAFGLLVYYPARKLDQTIAKSKEQTGLM